MAYNTPRSLKKKYGKVAYLLYGLSKFRLKINNYKVKEHDKWSHIECFVEDRS